MKDKQKRPFISRLTVDIVRKPTQPTAGSISFAVCLRRQLILFDNDP